MKARFEPEGVSFGGTRTEPGRRHNLRLGPPTRLRCSLKDLSGEFVPRDISAGGFSIISDQELREGDMHEVTLTLDDLRVVTSAKVIHCRAVATGQWIAGLKFLGTPREGSTAELIDRIAPELGST